MNLVHPQLIGKLLQKVEEDEEGNLFIHFKAYVLKVEQDSQSGVLFHELTPREGKPEPLVIPAKKA